MKKAAGVLVIRDGLVLSLVRADGKGVGLLCGKVEPGEDPAQTALREAAEEAGVNVGLIDEPYVAMVGDVQVWTWRAVIFGTLGSRKTPEEGHPAWVPFSVVCAGPFGEYNRAAIAALAPEARTVDLDAAFAAEDIGSFLQAAFPSHLQGVAARIIESGAYFDTKMTKWAPRWSGIPLTKRKSLVGGLAEKLASVLYRSHDCIHQLWGLPALDPDNDEDCALYKRTQMCGEVAVLTLTEFVLAAAWVGVDPAYGPILDQRNALPLLQGPLRGLSTREIAARLDGVLHQRLGRPPLWVREDPIARRFVDDYGRMLEDDRESITHCLLAMRAVGWAPSGPRFRPAPQLDGLELTLWMIDDFEHLARTSPDIDFDLAAFNRERRERIVLPTGWRS